MKIKENIGLILSTIQTILLIVIVFILLTDNKSMGKRPGNSNGQMESLTKVKIPLKIYDTDAIWGNKDAPYTLIAFVDYQCPFCNDVYKNLKELEKDYIATGKVKVIFRDFPLKMHSNAKIFASAVECARQQGKFWEMADLVFESNNKSEEAAVDGWVETLKLNKENFTACIDDSLTDKAIEKDMEEAKSYMVRGTPALFINNIFYRGTQSVSTLKDILDGKKVDKKPKSGSCNQRNDD